MRKFWILFLLFFAGTAHAAQFLKVTKSNSVIAYKEPTTQSKMLSVFAQDDEIEIVLDKDGWYKVKVPFQQGYFLLGWVPKNVPNITVIQRGGSSVVSPGTTEQAQVVPDVEKKPAKRSTGKDISVSSDMDRWSSESKQHFRLSIGPVYNLYKYEEFQYKIGIAYEIPMSQRFKLGVPVSYTTGGLFNVIAGGLDGLYSFYFGWVAVSPKLGLAYEHFYGNGVSFQALSCDLGASVDVSISDHITVGVEPFTIQAMGWNNGEIPMNVRGQSLLVVRGRW
jgi:hypothetical protein